ncbi:hypothetical protein [Sphingomonas sp. SORGH_AS_0879]|uniref:hypothetical protein n=1 Tax=Sphingomonas sp. SORGH_AS_0879 TaxID=3041790 RepID=UPI0027D81ED0|nr:hypothetical protein [Sphingomonas sp. SORGH_AS_0879]
MSDTTSLPMPGRPVGLGIRLFVCLALVILLVITLVTGIANMVRSTAPELALRLAPWNGPAAANAAEQLVFSDPKQSERALGLAQRALRRDPTLVAAVTARGIVEELQGHADASRHDLVYSAWLSRRHLPTQLWWIEYGAAHANIPLALLHYDLALRAIPQAPDILFPILGSAIAQPEVRRKLLPILREAPAWRKPFFHWLATNGVDYPSTALLLSDLRLKGNDLPPALYGQVENGLIAQEDYDAAWNFYRQRHPNARRDATQDVTFRSASAGYRSPFDWNVLDGQGEAVIGQQGGDFVLSFSTIPTNSTQLARQTMLLPPGHYTLRDDVRFDAAPVKMRPYWIVQCLDGRKLVTIPIGSKIAQPFAMPMDCPVQWLILASDASDTPQGSEGVIHSVMVQRNSAGNAQ